MWIVLEATIDFTTMQDHCCLPHLEPYTCHWNWMMDFSIPIFRDTILCHFFSYNAFENEVHFMLKCPLYNPIRDKFPSLFENVVPRNLKSFFQSDQQINISLYLTEATALRHSKELNGLKPSWCTFNPVSLFGFPNFKINFVSTQ